ncbi:caspase b-like [Ctenopharyngodon idella]|uniref:caspase b-like n=1 Tax=Ctenopharyngodon idella TaxID=7959 RepID=UPI0022327F06|nr:caspase b-like [Ctenopharyngodon idella]XP_051742227.1 caspase b-like [Ctenopharyngodon idella]
MDVIKKLMIDALEELVDEDFKKFNWQLWNGLVTDMGPIPRAKLQKADRSDVVDHMVDKYSDEAGNIAVKALRNINQNHLAKTLESKLQEAHPPVQQETRNAPVSVEEQPIQSDWKRPDRITPSSQEFKNRILTEKRNDIYIPKDKSQRNRLALLITNIQFKHLSDRRGAEEDEKNMKWLLEALGYRVEKHTNFSGEQIDAAVRNFAASPGHRDSDSTFVVLMSHGDIIQNKDAILGVNYHRQHNPDDVFFVDEIFTHLNSVNCPALIDKPKVILIQACRGEHTGGLKVQSDAAHRAVHIEKDFVSFKSCLPGIHAYRDVVEGSYFICYILEVFCKRAHIDDIMELFRKVTSCMEKDPLFKQLEVEKDKIAKLMPCIDRMSLPKHFYLFPGL